MSSGSSAAEYLRPAVPDPYARAVQAKRPSHPTRRSATGGRKVNPCRRCGNTTDEADGLHGDCRVKTRRDLEMYQRLAAQPGHDLSIALTYSPLFGGVRHRTWKEYYQSRVEEVQALLLGPAAIPRKKHRKGKTERPEDPPTHVSHRKAKLVTGERPKRRARRK